MLTTDQAHASSGEKITAALAALGILAVLLIIAALVVVMPRLRDEPEIVAQVIAPVQQAEVKMEKKQVTKQAEQVSTAAAASPIAKMVRSQSVAAIAAPEVTKVSDGPIGLGEGEFGSGFGSGAGDGSGGGSGMTLFGSKSASRLKGSLYDLKRNPDGTSRDYPVGNGPATYGIVIDHVRQLERSRYSKDALQRHMKVGDELGYSFLAVPEMSADAGPEAFGAGGKMEPSGWLAVYQGKIEVDLFPGVDLRFLGRFDDLMLVYLNGKIVFDGSWISGERPVSSWRPSSTGPAGHPIFNIEYHVGDWVMLRPGDELTIVVGEIPGGRVSGGLFCQVKGVNYDKGKFSPFVVGKLTPQSRERLGKIPGVTMENIPVIY